MVSSKCRVVPNSACASLAAGLLVDEGRMGGQHVAGHLGGVEYELVGPVEPDVAHAIVKAERLVAAGKDAAGERIGADLGVVAAPVPDQGEARIGNDVPGLVAVVGNLAGGLQGLGVEAFVDVDLGIQEIVPQRVGPGSDDALRQASVEHGRGHRGRRQRRSVVGKSPHRRRIPGVRHRRAVVGGHAPQQVVAEQLDLADMADIHIVGMSLLGHAILGHLDESAGLCRDLSGVIERGDVERDSCRSA